MGQLAQAHMAKQNADLDLLEQIQIYEAVLRCEDGEDDTALSIENIRYVGSNMDA